MVADKELDIETALFYGVVWTEWRCSKWNWTAALPAVGVVVSVTRETAPPTAENWGVGLL